MSLKYSFYNDYSEGAHPRILKALEHTNLSQEVGYGLDSASLEAARLIQSKLGSDSAVHLVSGGTQANLTVIGAILRPHESVIAASTGHICVHEAGSVEATGHKIHAVLSSDGKLLAEQITQVVQDHHDEHMVKPKLVYVSNATELGTAYTKSELEKLSKCCKKNNLWLYLDGARLGSALVSKNSDLTFQDLAKHTDVLYIGGTKNGALLGEAVVINNPELREDFRYHLKQRGALLAKGRVLGLQFAELFRDNLYLDLAKHAVDMAMLLAQGLSLAGYTFLTPPETNMVFPILPNSLITTLEKDFGFYRWQVIDSEHTAVRLATSWATRATRPPGAPT